MANSWYTKDVRVKVPETVRFVLSGELRQGVSAKDVMLYILSQPFFRTSKGIGKVLEFAGEGVSRMPLDERATLTNMAVEAGGFTGIIEADEVVVDYIHEMRGTPKDQIRAGIVKSDPDASYVETFDIDLAEVPSMVATPGDPRNGIALSDVGDKVKIDIAYGGSCTGGKKSDMDMYAAVLREAEKRGMRVAPDVRCYIQFGSQHIRDYAAKEGLHRPLPARGRRGDQPELRRLHQRGAWQVRRPEPGHGQRPEPQLPGPLGARQRLPGEPPHRRRQRRRGLHRDPRRHLRRPHGRRPRAGVAAPSECARFAPRPRRISSWTHRSKQSLESTSAIRARRPVSPRVRGVDHLCVPRMRTSTLRPAHRQ